ncbi:hypothetical protein GUITHDRAFT_101052 [Guillardia theta CCMP2712]|uniref:Uncharacterized protein n=1 Tax=Guillardia theta (strain CCMP2712) TaxID=905079 RepID=L1JYF0_GUITC|nr:hypothetical protein GUITHDRAFT_101052 [Guillardia theta CCMP2712]EKX53349.1 hypothetical protein GUITHDRAFT_101052 [Guillardia theta CCMP2712]|eukprot:XP_005840329.1 hypothetical protein GUITHDRAFT_101052 [Guillardia theta CCMP2712]
MRRAESSMCFKFVYIPCEPGMPMEEWELFPKKGDDEISCLTVHLQKWFSKSGRLSDDQKAQLKEQVKLHAQKKNLTVDNVFENSTISDDILQTESVEIITLLPPMQEHGYVSVSMYVDDKGLVRNLLQNDRASGLMESLTSRRGPVLGDAFLGRCYDNEQDTFKRLDFLLTDVSSSAGWAKICLEQKKSAVINHERMKEHFKQLTTSKVPKEQEETADDKLDDDLRSDLQQSLEDENDVLKRDGYASFPARNEPIPCSDEECFRIYQEIKGLGHESLKNRIYDLALRRYQKAKRYLMHRRHLNENAIKSISEKTWTENLVSCDLNIALAGLKLGRSRTCEKACKSALQLDPKNVKALYRMGLSLKGRGEYRQAQEFFNKCLALSPNPAAKEAIQACMREEKMASKAASDFATKIFSKGLGSFYPDAKPAEEEGKEEEPPALEEDKQGDEENKDDNCECCPTDSAAL